MIIRPETQLPIQKVSVLRLVPIALGLLLSGCATYSPTRVDNLLADHQTLSLQQLIARWGVPAKQYELDNKLYVEWLKQDNNESSSSISIGTGTGGRGWFGAFGLRIPLESQADTCVIRAETNLERTQIFDLKWQGDSDYCGSLLDPETNK